MHFLTLLLALPVALAAPVLDAVNGAEIIPGKFIVVMNPSVSDSVLSSTIKSVTDILGAAPGATYNLGNFKGFSVSASEALIQTISNLGNIEFVEPDTVVRASALMTQQNPPYGLARISHRKAGSKQYIYDSSAGAGTVAYGIDTGIYCGHHDFGGRCTFGANFAGDNNNTDGNGHGTHTAGTIGSTTYGVAKKTQLISVKVLGADGSGSNANVISGIQWAANDMLSRGKVGKAVGNLSLGGPRLGEASNRAVAAAVQKGMVPHRALVEPCSLDLLTYAHRPFHVSSCGKLYAASRPLVSRFGAFGLHRGGLRLCG